MSLDTLPEHIRKPHVRPYHPIPMQQSGQMVIALRDPAMLSPQTMAVPPQVVRVVQQFQGQLTVEQISQGVGMPLEQLLQVVQALESVGLLWGETFGKLEAQARQRIAEAGHFPMTASRALGATDADCRAKIEEYFSETEDPELTATPIGVVAPHIDYERGWPVYAAAYHSLQKIDAPDRVVILGTNHFGAGDGVVLSEFGFESPMGICPADAAVIDKLREAHDDKLTIDQLDHLGEHSINLQLPWLQYCFGNVPVVGALVPDPLAGMIEDDGARLSGEEFVATLSEALQALGGRTFFVASSDLSHVGPQFGEPRPVDEQRRFDVERHDREMMAKFLENDAAEFIAAMKWNNNPTRWCSIGNMAATLSLALPKQIELIDYRQACDDKGQVMVSCAAMALI